MEKQSFMNDKLLPTLFLVVFSISKTYLMTYFILISITNVFVPS